MDQRHSLRTYFINKVINYLASKCLYRMKQVYGIFGAIKCRKSVYGREFVLVITTCKNHPAINLPALYHSYYVRLSLFHLSVILMSPLIWIYALAVLERKEKHDIWWSSPQKAHPLDVAFILDKYAVCCIANELSPEKEVADGHGAKIKVKSKVIISQGSWYMMWTFFLPSMKLVMLHSKETIGQNTRVY